MAGPKTPSMVHDFVVLPLRLPRQPSYPQESTHYLYLRANAPKAPTENTPREVFLVNVPVDATETHIRSLFADQLGGARIESLAFEGARVGKGISAPVAPAQSKKRKRGVDENEATTEAEVGLLPETWDRELHRSGGIAIVSFVDQASAQLALKEAKRAVKSKKDITWGAGISNKLAPLGKARYLSHHRLRYPDHALLQQSVDSFMVAFSAQEEARARALAKQRSEPDEDGFITVTRGGRSGPAREEEVKAKEEELKKREKNRIKDDFYRFQVREKKKDHAKDLVRGFEEDQRRVEEMKKRRGRIRPE
ncbi:hypothetical protein DOTSEDRAFT_168167 [Dothistroma septosporum NZE10]|uniref:Ribosomal RNA-processing protein 7 C-terminal domain-containing protein n=1 Tax=Dothistroma septosporum (strain NZE10 / CBS 128990) TaxID=675120 RepID=N1PRE7_DOTSN|nr:hypothetical protein DOTSEDRAFT_168167 [Dothistroma septosporum NZE10]